VESLNGIGHVGPDLQHWVLNFKCNVSENQSEPCILLKYLFFLMHELLQRVLVHFRAAWRRSSANASLAGGTRLLPVPPALSPHPLTYSSFVGLAIFTYKFTFLYFAI
jgi:hypothetical protein